MQFTFFTAIALAALGASAGPIDKRNGEGVHLANCYQNSPLGQVPYSEFVYYADDAQASQNVVPSKNNQVIVKSAGTGGFQVWEGSPITRTFPTNTWFTSNIQSGAGSYAVGQYAG